MFIYFVWMALFANGGIFGNRGTDAATQGALTRAELYDGFNTQALENRINDVADGLCAQNSTMLQGFNSIGGQIAENRFASQQCCCTTQRAIDALSAENYRNTCEITTAIHAEGEATRALITENQIQNLRDQLANKDRELLTSNLFSAQQAQTQNLIGALRPFPTPAYITTSPYASATTTCGCNGIYA